MDCRLRREIVYNEYGCKDGDSVYYDSRGKLVNKCNYSKDLLVKETLFEEKPEE